MTEFEVKNLAASVKARLANSALLLAFRPTSIEWISGQT
jgi:hypothetical protein